jgi:hypothetical protein
MNEIKNIQDMKDVNKFTETLTYNQAKITIQYPT